MDQGNYAENKGGAIKRNQNGDGLAILQDIQSNNVAIKKNACKTDRNKINYKTSENVNI